LWTSKTTAPLVPRPPALLFASNKLLAACRPRRPFEVFTVGIL